MVSFQKAHFVFTLFLLLTFIVATSCATSRKNLVTGAVLGGASGALSGALIAQRRKGEAALTMGLIFAFVGATGGFFADRAIKKESERVRRQTLFNIEQYGMGTGDPAVLSPAKVQEYDVEAKVEGEKLIGPHKVWMIRKGANWRLNGKGDKHD